MDAIPEIRLSLNPWNGHVKKFNGVRLNARQLIINIKCGPMGEFDNESTM